MLGISAGIDIYIGILAFVLGACIGSFLNCMAWRIVNNESVLKGRSHCDECGHVLSGKDLIPIASFIAVHGKCRYCGKKLSSGHVWAEVLTGIAFVAIVFRYDISLQALEMLLLAVCLLASAFADLKGYIIPDRFILAGIVFRIPFFFLLPGWKDNLIDALIGGFAVGGGLLLLVLLYEKLRKIDAMGGGDLKLLFVTGLYLGWAKNILCLLIACILGIVFGLVFKTRCHYDDIDEDNTATKNTEDQANSKTDIHNNLKDKDKKSNVSLRKNTEETDYEETIKDLTAKAEELKSEEKELSKNIISDNSEKTLNISKSEITSDIENTEKVETNKSDESEASAEDDNGKMFPWGPAICAAAIITMIIGDPLVNAYLQLFS